MINNDPALGLQEQFRELIAQNVMHEVHQAYAPVDVVDLSETRSRSRIPALALRLSMVATAGLGLFAASNGGESEVVNTPYTASAPEIDLELQKLELAGLVTVVEPGVVGEAPCGPKIDIAEATERFEAGEQVVKPFETSDFFDAHPEVEQGHSDFLAKHYDQKFNDWIIANKPVVQSELIDDEPGAENSLARQLMARMEFRILDGDVGVQNHQCDIETGRIYKVNNITKLQKGEQVWAFSFTKAEAEQMAKDGVTIPEKAPTISDDDPNIATVMLTERGPCVNPLLDRDVPPETPSTTPPETTPTTTGTTGTTIHRTTTIPKKVQTCPVPDKNGNGKCDDSQSGGPGAGGEPGPKGTTSIAPPKSTTTSHKPVSTTGTTGPRPTAPPQTPTTPKPPESTVTTKPNVPTN